jgi:hypothetical protein
MLIPQTECWLAAIDANVGDERTGTGIVLRWEGGTFPQQYGR